MYGKIYKSFARYFAVKRTKKIVIEKVGEYKIEFKAHIGRLLGNFVLLIHL